MATNQPLLTAALNQLYDNLLDRDDDDFKRENSATQAFLLLSEYYRHSGNPYFLRKIKEQPALVNFAYKIKKLNEDGAAKVLKAVMSTWTTKNSGYPKDVKITNIITLEDALLTFKAHINHVTAYEFILQGYPLISNISDLNTVPEKIFEILNRVISTLPSHIPPSDISDPLYEANNFFALAYLKLCRANFEVDLRLLNDELRKLEYSEPDQDRIMRHITSHHEYAGTMQELGSASLDWENYPTTMLFEDIDEQLEMHGVELQAFPEIGRMLGFEVQLEKPGLFDGDEDGDYDGDYDDGYDEDYREEEEQGEDGLEVNPENEVEHAEYETNSKPEGERLEDGYAGGSDNDEVMSGTGIHGELDEVEDDHC